jgi:hypothetical protein
MGFIIDIGKIELITRARRIYIQTFGLLVTFQYFPVMLFIAPMTLFFPSDKLYFILTNEALSIILLILCIFPMREIYKREQKELRHFVKNK